MLVPLKSGADFSRESAHSATRPRISTTRPRRLAIRELTPATGQLRNSERGRSLATCPAHSIRYMRLGHKLIYIVVVAVVYAMDVTMPTVPACPRPITDTTLGEGCHPGTIAMQVKIGYRP